MSAPHRGPGPGDSGVGPGPGRVDEDRPHRPRDWSDRHDRRRTIAEAAWFKAERRGFVPGDELLDWLEAERELERHFEGGEHADADDALEDVDPDR